MFTTPCFILKNTPELVIKLKTLGYSTKEFYHFSQEEYLIAYKGTYLSENTITDDYLETCIDCGTNEELFLALAALRDDSDKNQWFVTEKERHWVNQETFMPIGSFIFSYVDNYSKYDKEVHKASVEELIQHFKNK